MDAKVNILIDGGFYVQKFKEREGRLPNANDIENEIAVIMAETQKKTGADCKDILFRVFYYDCSPFDGKVKKPGDTVETDYSQTKAYTAKERVLKSLAQKERFAVRLGELSFDGWSEVKKTDPATGVETTDYVPKLRQKGVDMKVGLDMAYMALKHTVDKVVLVAGDSDFVAPMKFVRREGLQVYLYSMGHKVKAKLIEHSDFVLS
jgi:uncharacterized LabA/DUF88 family protein